MCSQVFCSTFAGMLSSKTAKMENGKWIMENEGICCANDNHTSFLLTPKLSIIHYQLSIKGCQGCKDLGVFHGVQKAGIDQRFCFLVHFHFDVGRKAAHIF